MNDSTKAVLYKLVLTIHASTMTYLATAGLAPGLSWAFQVGASLMFGIAILAVSHALHLMKPDK